MANSASYPKSRRRAVETDHPGGPVLRGANLALWDSTDHEIVVSGPSETGKTFAALLKLDALLTHVKGVQAVLVRKVRDTIYSTVLQTYLHKIQPFPGRSDVSAAGVRRYGGERPAWFDYPGGGRLWLAGIDDPGKALSSERDYVYVNQAEELAEDDWQVLTTRATGRAGHTADPQVFGDCNPGPEHHWIRRRGSLRLLHSTHEDNPALHDGRDWTEQGRRTLAVLDALTGVRKERLRYGRWVSAEGAVFPLDAARHVLGRAELVARGVLTADGSPGPAVRHRIAGVDWGYTAPGCLGVWLADGDGRAYLAREWYHTGRLIEWWVARGKRARSQYGVTDFECDPSEPAYLKAFTLAGLGARPADNDRWPGIQAVQARFADAGDGRPRIFLAADALEEPDPDLLAARQPTCTEQEAGALVHHPKKEGETVGPDHGWDAARYALRRVDVLARPGAGTITFGPPCWAARERKIF